MEEALGPELDSEYVGGCAYCGDFAYQDGWCAACIEQYPVKLVIFADGTLMRIEQYKEAETAYYLLHGDVVGLRRVNEFVEGV